MTLFVGRAVGYVTISSDERLIDQETAPLRSPEGH